MVFGAIWRLFGFYNEDELKNIRREELQKKFPDRTEPWIKRYLDKTDDEIAELDKEMTRLILDYSALSEEKLYQQKEIGLTGEQLKKMNKLEVAAKDKMLDRLCLSIHDQMSPDKKEIRLLMLGKTGAGKSSAGNLILGRPGFDESVRTDSCTFTISLKETEIDGVKVKIIDTPGFNDTRAKFSEKDILTEISKVADEYKEGIDGILFIYNLGNPRFTPEEKSAFEQLQEGVLGGNFVTNCFIILSHGSQLKDTSLEEFIKGERKSDFGQLVHNIVNKRVMAIENAELSKYGREVQRRQLVRMVAAKVSVPCTPETFKEYIDHRNNVIKQIDEKVQSLVPEIEELVAAKLRHMKGSEIQRLTGDEKNAIIQKVYEDVKTPAYIDEEKIKDGIKRILEGTIERLTGNIFLKVVKGLAKPLLAAAGVVKGLFSK